MARSEVNGEDAIRCGRSDIEAIARAVGGNGRSVENMRDESEVGSARRESEDTMIAAIRNVKIAALINSKPGGLEEIQVAGAGMRDVLCSRRWHDRNFSRSHIEQPDAILQLVGEKNATFSGYGDSRRIFGGSRSTVRENGNSDFGVRS